MEITKEQLSGDGLSLLDVAVNVSMTKSKGDARRAIESGGVYLNNIRTIDTTKRLSMNDTIHGKFILLRKGGKNYFLVKVK